MEFAYFLLRQGKKDDINKYFDDLLKYNVNYDEGILIKAAEMKFKFLKERLSFIDCIGYILAKRNKTKFLTGDEKFRKMESVEFVK